MELELREWIMVASAVLMVAVVAPGFWMRWRSRRNRLRLEIDPNLPPRDEVNELDLLRAELPAGGGRPARPSAARGGADEPRPLADLAGRVRDQAPPVLLNALKSRSPARLSPQVGDAPADTDPAAAATGEVRVASAPEDADAAWLAELDAPLAPVQSPARDTVRGPVREPAPDPVRDPVLDADGEVPSVPVRTTFRNEIPPAPAPTAASTVATSSPEPPRDLLGDVPPAIPKPAGLRRRRTVAERPPEAAGTPDPPTAPPGPQELIVMHVICREYPGFSGDQLVTSVGRAGLKYGDMNIFHRLQGGAQEGGVKPRRIVYSMASAVEPGSFDLSTITDTKIPGVSFFLQLPGPVEPSEAFEDMLAVARDIGQSLHGDLKDENQSVMTGQTVEHYRQRVRDFARKQQIRG